MRLDLLRHDFAQDHRLSEILRTNYDEVGARRTRREQGHERQDRDNSCLKSSHLVRRRFSSNPTPKSADSARIAAGMAPAKITELSTMAKPRKINSPSPPAPIAAAIVARPMEMTIATRRPERITLTANGNST